MSLCLHVARLSRRRRRAYARAIPLAMINMRKSTHGFPFVSHIWVAYGAPLGGPLGHWSSANNSVPYICSYTLCTLYFLTFLSGYDCGYTSLAVYGAAVLDHCLMEEGFPENAKIGKGFNLEEG